MITFEDVVKVYRGGATAVDHLSLELPTGKLTVLVGPSGCGKTTSLRMINRMIAPTSGRILIDGKDVAEQDEALLRRALEEFARGRTTFLITHNLGSLQFADRIVLLNEGRVEAVGTESDLRRTSPLFRRLYEIHFQRDSA